MPTYAQKHQQSQQGKSGDLARPSAAARLHELHPILHLQRTIGNQAVLRMLQTHAKELKTGLTGTSSSRSGRDFSQVSMHPPTAGPIQTKLALNKPGDKYEQEADRISEHVMRMPEPQFQCACPCGGGCPKCHTEQPGREHESLQTKRVQASDTGQIAAPPIVHELVRSLGQPLDPATRAFMEPRFGYDFSRVRVHTDAAAEQSARDVNAHAYTVGNDMVFAAGRFAPESPAGGRLLAHELTHVVQQSGGAAAVQRQPVAPDPSAERVAAAAEAEAVASVTSEQTEAQSEAEDALKLDWRKRNDKGYAWSLGLKDRARLQKRLELSPELQQEITVKIRFFGGEAKAAYIRTISPALADFPSEQVIEILAEPAGTSATGGERTQGLACDVGAKQFLLQYEGAPKKSRCMDIEKDPEFKADYFDKNITGAVGYAVEATTWENVAYDRFKVMLVNYKNGASEFFLLDEVGNFYYGGKTLITLEHSYLKRENGLIYPLRKGQIYFNEVLTPNIIAYKNGLKYQTKDLQGLYTLLEVGGKLTMNMAWYGAGAGTFKTAINAFRRSAPARLPGRPLPGRITTKTRQQGGVPEPISEEAPTGRIRAEETGGERVGEFRIIGEKGLNGRTFERNITGFYRIGGRGGPKKTADIGPIMRLGRTLVQEAKAAGATELKITGELIGNENLFEMQGMVGRFGGTVRQTGPASIEIIIPIQ